MTDAQAKKLAKQIFDRFDGRIVEATNGSNVPPKFVAGLIGNEAGKDKQGKISETATRFEKHVFASLQAVRDGRRSTYSGIKRSQIQDSSDAALRALATSYGITQIMGWHCINNLKCTIADLRNPDKHLFYTVRLLQLNGFPKNATKAEMDGEMRQWNTGRENGQTYHDNYVPNAIQVRAAYSELEKTRTTAPFAEEVDESGDTRVTQEYGVTIPEKDESEDTQPTDGKPESVVLSEPSVEKNREENSNSHEFDGITIEGDGNKIELPPPAAQTPAFDLNDAKNTIEQQIPRVTAGTRWLGGLGLGGLVSTALATFNGLPPWAIFVLGLLTASALIALFLLFKKYYAQVFSMVTQAMKINADPTLPNVKLISRGES